MIWLSSFPRSGITFVRNILYEVYGLESSTFHRETSYPIDVGYNKYPFVKTHELPSTFRKFDGSIPVVYLVRDGRDAVCSMAHHRADLIEPGSDYYENLKEIIFAEKNSHFGGWSKNAEEWLNVADLVIRFEDLLADPIKTVAKLRSVYPLPEPKLEALPTFEALKFGIPKYGAGRDLDISEQEKKSRAKKFFRRGRSGAWKADMPEDLQDLFWSLHGETMSKFGYSETGEVLDPHPDFDANLLSKFGDAVDYRHAKKRKVLIESNKIVSPDNDGVKRYQVELLKSFLPVVESPHSRWQIDLYIRGKITPLRDCREILFQGFLAEHVPEKIQTSEKLARGEKKLVELVPRGFVRLLEKNGITVFHTCYELMRGLAISVVKLVGGGNNGANKKLLPVQDNGVREKLNSYDLIHLPLKQHYKPFQKTQNKKVITIHDLTHLHYPEFHTGENVSNADKGLKFAIDSNADLIAISQSTSKDILKGTPVSTEKVHLIYEAADRTKFNFKINNVDRQRAKEKYGLYFHEPYIICLSTLEPRKNLKNTIKAYILLRQDHPEIPLKLVIAGKKGWDTESIYSAAGEYSDHIFFTGFVDDDDLACLYSGATALSYVSFYEGFGLPPLEAMCCGTPVIYGNNSSLIEVVGEGGLPADSYDLNDIKTQYERIFFEDGLRDSKSKAALKQSLKYSWRDSAIETLNLYERIIDDKV